MAKHIVKELITAYSKQMMKDFKANTNLTSEVYAVIHQAIKKKLLGISEENLLNLPPVVIMGEVEQAVAQDIKAVKNNARSVVVAVDQAQRKNKDEEIIVVEVE